MLDAILTTLAFLIIFVLVDVLAHTYKPSADFTRKIAHILSGTVTFFSAFYLTKAEIIAISIFFLLVLLFAKYLNLIKSIHAVDRRTYGDLFFPLGNILCALLFLPHAVPAFQFGVLIVAYADAFAALVGISFGKHQILILKNKKSLEGSLMFFVVSCMVWVFFNKELNYKTMSVPFILMITELVLIFGLDNLFLPSLAAYLFTMFG